MDHEFAVGWNGIMTREETENGAVAFPKSERTAEPAVTYQTTAEGFNQESVRSKQSNGPYGAGAISELDNSTLQVGNLS